MNPVDFWGEPISHATRPRLASGNGSVEMSHQLRYSFCIQF